MVDVKEIVADYLIANGYDGLFDGDDCGCEVADLFPCGCVNNCKAAYKVVCNYGCGEYGFCMSETKQRGCSCDEREWEHDCFR